MKRQDVKWIKVEKALPDEGELVLMECLQPLDGSILKKICYEIRASEMQMLDGKPADGDMRAPAPAKAPARSAYADAKEGRTTAPAPDSFSDDDIPF